MSPLLTLLVQQPAESDEVTRNSFLSTAAILVGILVGLGTLAGMTKRWINNLIVEQQQSRNQQLKAQNETKKSLKTSNGKTVGEYSEEMYNRMDSMCENLEKTREVSLSALALTRHNASRLDQHMEGHVPKEK